MCLKSLKLVKQASQHSIWDIAGITKGCCLHCVPRHSFLSLGHVDPSDLMPCSLFHAANNRFLLPWPPLRMGWGPSCLARWLLGCCSGTEETSFCSSQLGQSCNFCFWFLVLLLLLDGHVAELCRWWLVWDPWPGTEDSVSPSYLGACVCFCDG